MGNNKMDINSYCGSQKTCTMGSKTIVCPWYKFKKMKMEDIVEYFDNASHIEVERLMLYSKQCDNHKD